MYAPGWSNAKKEGDLHNKIWGCDRGEKKKEWVIETQLEKKLGCVCRDGVPSPRPSGMTSIQKESEIGTTSEWTTSTRGRTGLRSREKTREGYQGTTYQARSRPTEDTVQSLGGSPPDDDVGPPKMKRDPSEAHPRPTSPRNNSQPSEYLADEHLTPANMRPRPVERQKGRRPAPRRRGL